MDSQDLMLAVQPGRKIFGKALLLGMAGLALSGLLFININYLPSTLLWRQILNSSHLLLFMTLGYIILKLTNLYAGPAHTWSARNYLKAFLFGAAFAPISEWLQQFVGRQFEVRDILTDMAGLLVIHNVYFLSANRKNLSRIPFLLKSLILAGLPLLLFAVFGDLLITVHHVLVLQRQLPLITSFEQSWELFRWEVHGSTQVRIVADEVHPGQHFLKIKSQSGTFPGVTLESPPTDWQPYQGLRFRVYSTEPTAFELSVRIDAQSAASPRRTSVYFTFGVKPGNNDFTVLFSEINARATKTGFDFSNVRRFVIFLNRPKLPRTYFLDDISLVESSSEKTNK